VGITVTVGRTCHLIRNRARDCERLARHVGPQASGVSTEQVETNDSELPMSLKQPSSYTSGPCEVSRSRAVVTKYISHLLIPLDCLFTVCGRTPDVKLLTPEKELAFEKMQGEKYSGDC